MVTPTPLEKFIHDVDSKCIGIKRVAALLPGSPPDGRDELLQLMRQEAHALVAVLESFKPKP